MAAEIIRGVDFNKKKRLGGGGSDGGSNEGKGGVLTTAFFYRNFIIASRKGKDGMEKKKIFHAKFLHYLANVVNPNLEVNKKRPAWAKESLGNLLRALALVQHNRDVEYNKTSENAFQSMSNGLEYAFVYKGHAVKGEVGNARDYAKVLSILK